MVVDTDSPVEFDFIEQTFGYTPAMIATRRGRHFIYRADGSKLGNVGSLRECGHQIDVKHGQSGSGISVAPPSLHPDQKDFAYYWYSNSGLEVLVDLPPFNSRALNDLLSRSTSLRDATHTAAPEGCSSVGSTPHWFREGSRKLALNDYLCAQAAFFDELDDCLDAARTWSNLQLQRHNIIPLPDDEILTVCKSIMADLAEGKLVRTLALRAIATTDADEVRRLASDYNNGDAALMLLMLFGLRQLRGQYSLQLVCAPRHRKFFCFWNGAWIFQRFPNGHAHF